MNLVVVDLECIPLKYEILFKGFKVYNTSN